MSHSTAPQAGTVGALMSSVDHDEMFDLSRVPTSRYLTGLLRIGTVLVAAYTVCSAVGIVLPDNLAQPVVSAVLSLGIICAFLCTLRVVLRLPVGISAVAGPPISAPQRRAYFGFLAAGILR